MRTVTEKQLIMDLETVIAITTDFSLELMEGRMKAESTTNRIRAVLCVQAVWRSFLKCLLRSTSPSFNAS